MEWAPKVRVNAVTAGLIRTEQAGLHYGDDDAIAAVGATIPLGRMGEPDDYGGIVAMLASDDGRYITGQTISVSGGMNMI